MSVEVESPPLERLKGVLAELDDLRHAEAILDWDSRVSMPRQGAAARADATATITRFIHERFVSDEVGQLLEELAPLERERGHDSFEGALVRLTRREWERARRVPPELTGEISHAAGIAVAAWDEAKAASDFPSFVPHLERMLELKQRYVACFPPTESPYDVLLEDYEEGMTTAQVTQVFDRLKRELVPLVERRGGEAGDDAFLRGPFPAEAQREAGRRVLTAFGFTDESWRLDETPHPFAQKPGHNDIRLTTHTDEGDLMALFSTASTSSASTPRSRGRRSARALRQRSTSPRAARGRTSSAGARASGVGSIRSSARSSPACSATSRRSASSGPSTPCGRARCAATPTR